MLCITCFDNYYFPLLFCPIKLPLSQPTDFTFFIPPVSLLPFGLGRGVSEQMCGVYPAGLNHNSPL